MLRYVAAMDVMEPSMASAVRYAMVSRKFVMKLVISMVDIMS